MKCNRCGRPDVSGPCCAGKKEDPLSVTFTFKTPEEAKDFKDNVMPVWHIWRYIYRIGNH